MTPWRRLVGDRPIVTRLVLAVAAAMSVVLLAAGGFVFWRVQFALDRQLDEDLTAYRELVERAVATGATPPVDTSGQRFQVYDARGRLIGGRPGTRLADPELVRRIGRDGGEKRIDIGTLIPTQPPYRVAVTRVRSPDGPVVLAAAISRRNHDEALRELLLQLLVADLATLAAASLVGYATARAALKPVERYRTAAEHSGAGAERRLPVPAGRDDELTRLGHTFNALLQRIEEGNRRERQFLADAAHELRSPLALMRTELEWALLHPGDGATTSTALESLNRQVDRLIDLSNALLDLEELRASTQTPSETVDVGTLVEEVSARFAARAAGEGRRIETHTDTGLEVEGNPHWLEVALGNLVANALRHGRGTVRITGCAIDGRTLLAVEDEGPGFPAEFVDTAFDRFARADTSRSTPGSGLGLAIVQAVAEKHHGRSVIDGTKVTIDLPRRNDPR